MPHEKLENLVRTGDLKSEPPDVDEVDGLIQSGLIRLEDSRNPDLGYESKFDLAYNAAHAFSLAALRIAGYRPVNRYLVFQCTKHTIALENEYWRVLDRAHTVRNLAEYEGKNEADESLVDALIRVADTVANRVQELAKQ